MQNRIHKTRRTYNCRKYVRVFATYQDMSCSRTVGVNVAANGHKIVRSVLFSLIHTFAHRQRHIYVGHPSWSNLLTVKYPFLTQSPISLY